MLRESTDPVRLLEGEALRVEGPVPHRLASVDGPATALVTVAAATGVAAGAHA
ncbi:hypothetical protein [Kineococcus sp. SYSU DK002]|uniref:hypothetical protein n=1 Tax=Kineococcus sp. SYSU DK002 TaxID=3383123 RepID=UPI003D7E604B